MAALTPEEARTECIATMGAATGEAYAALWQQVAWVHKKWIEYVCVFGTKPSRVDLMNQSAGVFFKVVQDSLWEDILLHIARLNDKPKTSGKLNLTLEFLALSLSGSPIEAHVVTLVRDSRTAAAFAMDSRHRRLAHLDLALALGKSAIPLSDTSRAQIRIALAAIASVLNAVAAHYLDSETDFGADSQAASGVQMLHVLHDGRTYAGERSQRLRSGNPRPSDLKPPEV